MHGLFKASRGLRLQQGPETTKFSNNALSACLRDDHPNCQKHLVRAPYPSSVAPCQAVDSSAAGCAIAQGIASCIVGAF